MSPKPLEGVKVVEVANWVSGPTCGVMLADYGAEVIKVEHLQTGGDPTRGWIPEPDPPPDQINYVFEHINRGKRSLALGPRLPRRARRYSPSSSRTRT